MRPAHFCEGGEEEEGMEGVAHKNECGRRESEYATGKYVPGSGRSPTHSPIRPGVRKRWAEWGEEEDGTGA